MEIWQDLVSGKFYKNSRTSGCRTPSTRFGEDLQGFIPYSTGYAHKESNKPIPYTRSPAIQPIKFDGYSQFPRPLDKSSVSSPLNRSPMAINQKIHIKDPSKFPQPLNFLTITKRNLRSNSASQCAVTSNLYWDRSRVETIESLKKQMRQVSRTEVKTPDDLLTSSDIKEGIYVQKNDDRARFKNRKKLKGYFFKEYKTSAELGRIERKICEMTIPGIKLKQQIIETADHKFIEKKRNAARQLFSISKQ